MMIHKRKPAVFWCKTAKTCDSSVCEALFLVSSLMVTSCLTFKPNTALSPVFLRVTGRFDDLRVSLVSCSDSSSSIFVSSSHLVPDILWQRRRLTLVCGRNLTRHSGAARWLVGLRHFNRVFWRDGAADGGQHWCHEHNKHFLLVHTRPNVCGHSHTAVLMMLFPVLTWQFHLHKAASSRNSFPSLILKSLNPSTSVRPRWRWSNLSNPQKCNSR